MFIKVSAIIETSGCCDGKIVTVADPIAAFPCASITEAAVAE